MILRYFKDEKLHTMLIQEPWIVRDRIRGLTASNLRLFAPQTNNKTRTCILARKGIQCVLMSDLCTPDLTVVRIGEDADSYVLASVYMPYDSRDLPPPPEVISLVQFCEARILELVLGCDANAHSTVWGGTDDNGRGTPYFSLSNPITCKL